MKCPPHSLAAVSLSILGLMVALATSGFGQSQLSIYNAIISDSVDTPSDIQGRAVISRITGSSSFSVGHQVTGAGTISLAIQSHIATGGQINVVNGSVWAPNAGSIARTINFTGGGSLVSSPPFDFSSIYNAAAAESASYAALPANSTASIPTSSPAVASLTIGSGVADGTPAVFNIDGASLLNNNLIQTIDLDLNGTNPSAIIINVTGTTVTYSDSGENVNVLRDVGLRPKILWNFPNAVTITLGKPLYGSVMAPNADLTALGGAIEGSVMARSYLGTVAVKMPLWGGPSVTASDHGDSSLFPDASSTPSTTITLGNLAGDAETSLSGNATATADDLDGADDEDGLVFSSLAVGGTGALMIRRENTSGADAYLSAWIDWDGDGVLGETIDGIPDQVVSNAVIPSGTSGDQSYTFPIPGTIPAGTVHARLRLTSTANPGFSGDVGEGEVEDHEVTIGAGASVSVNDVNVSESGGSATVSVKLASPVAWPVTVDYATSDGGATAGSDYSAVSGTATISAGSTKIDITIPILEDGLVEGPEKFHFTLSNPGSASISDSDATITINDNDSTSLSIGDASVTEGAATAEVVVSLTAASATAIQFDFATADGSALAGSDYTATTGSGTIPAGSTSITLSIPLLDDGTAEGTETFAVTLSNPTGAPIADGLGTITLNDNDLAALTVDDVHVSESATMVDVTVHLSHPSVVDTTFDYDTVDGTASEGTDYTQLQGSATIAAGSTSTVFTVSLMDDNLVEGDETVRFVITDAIGASIADQEGIITIGDDDHASLSIADLTASEGAGTADVMIVMTHPSTTDVTVDFATANGSATGGSDFVAVTGTATISAGTTTESVPVTVIDDALFERNEDFTFHLSNAAGASLSSTTATVTLVDNECDERTFVTEGGSADLYEIDFFTASFNSLASNIASDRINGVGYNPTDHYIWGLKQEAPWDTIVRINADHSVSEFVIAGLHAPDYEAGDIDDHGILHLGKQDSETVIRIDVNPTSPNYLLLLPELTLSQSRDWADWAFHPLDGHLYTIDRGEVIFRINTTTGKVTKLGGLKRILGDGLFGAVFSDKTGALYAVRDDTGIIYRIADVHLLTGGVAPVREYFSHAVPGNHRDAARCRRAGAPAPPLRLNIEDVIVTEADGMATLTVSLTSSTGSPVTVDYTTFPNTASAGSDYTAVSGNLTIPTGSTSRTIDVPILQDALPEGQESFFVSLTNPTGGNAILADDVGIVSITDDDAQDTDQDGAPDIDDVDDDDDGILDVDEALVNASCPNNVEVILLMDNSGSISSSEWDDFSAFTRNVIDELGASGTVRMAVAHYWSDWSGTTPYLYVESDFTTDPTAAKTFERRGTGQDQLERTIPLLRNALNGSGTGVSGGSSTLTHLPGSRLHVLFMTDAVRDIAGESTLVDPSKPADPFHFMNDFKTQFDATVTSIRFDVGIASYDSQANAAAAALASVGGVYTGNIEGNATDPDGSGATPRRFYNVNNFGGIPGTLAAELADLTCESTQDFDGDGVPDHLDIDSDNDGIPDNIEAQSTEGYREPNGDAGPANQGLDSAYTGGLTPVDSDQDGIVDVYDLNSDNDELEDIAENGDSDHTITGNDSDGDGLDDAFDTNHVTWDPNDRVDDPNPTTLGDIDNDLAADGDNATAMIRDVDFRDPGKEDSYSKWQSLYGSVLGAAFAPEDNPDGDLYDNLMEYAICLHPGTGIPGPGGFFVDHDGSGGIHLRFYRPKGGLSDVTYHIHALEQLPVLDTEVWSAIYHIPGQGSPPSGVTITDLGNALEEVRIDHLETTTPLTEASGFVRLAVVRGGHTSYGPVWGWTETIIEAGQTESYSIPFMKPESLSGTVTATVGTHGIDVSVATGGVPLETELQILEHAYYIEITEGDLEGHRFDVASVTGSTITLATDTDVYSGPPYNTILTPVTVPTTIAGDHFVLREHFTMNDYFPPENGEFTPQNHTFVPGHPADQVFLYKNDWEPYWLYKNPSGAGPYWDLDGDSIFVDAGNTAIPPGQGVFVLPQERDVTLRPVGIVRKNPFAMPLPKGWSLQASAFPMDQSPAERAMSEDSFDGSEDPATADNVCFWLGNGESYQPEFRCAFLFVSSGDETPRWLYADDEFLTPRDFETSIFPRDRSSFYFRINAAKPDYVIPLAWCVDLVGE